MEYRKYNDDLVIRMDRGEEILSSLKEVCLKEKILLGSISAIGAVDSFVVGVYDVEKKEYHSKEYNGAYEIVSLVGNISTMNDEYYSHLHLACADKENRVVGGHLNSARVSATVEMFLHVLAGKVDRIKDEETGLNIFKF